MCPLIFSTVKIVLIHNHLPGTLGIKDSESETLEANTGKKMREAIETKAHMEHVKN